MKAADRGILLGLLILGALAAFWFLLLSPKRAEASKLEAEIAETITHLAFYAGWPKAMSAVPMLAEATAGNSQE